jgi:hypothetical protein
VIKGTRMILRHPAVHAVGASAGARVDQQRLLATLDTPFHLVIIINY